MGGRQSLITLLRDILPAFRENMCEEKTKGKTNLQATENDFRLRFNVKTKRSQHNLVRISKHMNENHLYNEPTLISNMNSL